jgi:hypothetical protein
VAIAYDVQRRVGGRDNTGIDTVLGALDAYDAALGDAGEAHDRREGR